MTAEHDNVSAFHLAFLASFAATYCHVKASRSPSMQAPYPGQQGAENVSFRLFELWPPGGAPRGAESLVAAQTAPAGSDGERACAARTFMLAALT